MADYPRRIEARRDVGTELAGFVPSMVLATSLLVARGKDIAIESDCPLDIADRNSDLTYLIQAKAACRRVTHDWFPVAMWLTPNAELRGRESVRFLFPLIE